jgi:hypothetical protein
VTTDEEGNREESELDISQSDSENGDISDINRTSLTDAEVDWAECVMEDEGARRGDGKDDGYARTRMINCDVTDRRRQERVVNVAGLIQGSG